MILRKATLDDLDFLVRADLKSDDGTMTEQEVAAHRVKIRSYLTDPDKGAFIWDDGRPVAMIMYLVRSLDVPQFPGEIFGEIDRSVFPPDGRFLEVFQLWVDPAYRQRGLATALKRELEAESVRRGVRLIYTHTEETNVITLHLNRVLGYREVRRGPIWDEVIRVSLVKKV
ncbi:MAG TPA: GNAT family N-acetyltransferase [Symbiobacteriaceae bacterium]|nr:GNAT family N-acetyltransferase [Symbiobacteriaceae bacterium]